MRDVSRVVYDAALTKVRELQAAIRSARAICVEAADMGCECHGNYYRCNNCPDRIANRAQDAVEVFERLDVTLAALGLDEPPTEAPRTYTCECCGEQTTRPYVHPVEGFDLCAPCVASLPREGDEPPTEEVVYDAALKRVQEATRCVPEKVCEKWPGPCWCRDATVAALGLDEPPTDPARTCDGCAAQRGEDAADAEDECERLRADVKALREGVSRIANTPTCPDGVVRFAIALLTEHADCGGSGIDGGTA